MLAIIHTIITFRYALIFPIAVIEGPIIAVISGFLVHQHIVSLFLTYGVLLAADIVGDAGYYVLGRWGGRQLLDRFGKYIGAHPEKVALFEKQFEKHGNKIILIGKFTQVGGLPSLIGAGIARMPFVAFLIWNTIGSAIKIPIFMAIGYYFGAAYERINAYLNSFYTIGTLFLILLFLGTLVYLVHKEHKKRNENVV